jgi:anti-sigma B factor antagonist
MQPVGEQGNGRNEMAISVADGEQGKRVLVAGDLDLAAGDALEALVSPLIAADQQVEIDLRAVEFIDSSGLGALIELSQLAEGTGATLVLRAPSHAVVAVLDLTQTAPLFTVAV